MLVAWNRPWTRRHSIRFDGIVESHARIWPRAGARWQDKPAPPYCGAVTCQRSGSVRTLDDCVHCHSFVNLRPAPDRQSATLRCLSSDDDPLARGMSTPPGLLMVAPELPVATARLLAWAQDTPLLLVVDEGVIVGVVYASRLEHAEGVVASHMVVEPWSLTPVATLGDAVEALRELRVPGLLVVDATSELLAVVCAADLRRMGVPREVLPP